MNNTDKKIRVAVIYGGQSAEHEVSIRSARNVIDNLDRNKFEVVPIGINQKGRWFLGEDIFQQSLLQQRVPDLTDTWFTPEAIQKSLATSLASFPAGAQKAAFDVIFPVVHGTLCEDGTLQGLLELANLPYVGCGVLSSAVGMDKDISKRLVKQAGIKVPSYLVVKKAQWLAYPEKVQKEVGEKLAYPVFVKPANTGSSIGISKVKTESELATAMIEALRYDNKILIEEGLDIIELEVAVLEALNDLEDPFVTVVGEVRPTHEFYSYDAKYLDENGAALFIPAPISDELQAKARQAAKEIFNVLNCEGMARVDLFLTKNNHEIYFNEVNTLPGFTQISMYPKLMAASGKSYPQLLTDLIELAMKRYSNKNKEFGGDEKKQCSVLSVG